MYFYEHQATYSQESLSTPPLLSEFRITYKLRGIYAPLQRNLMIDACIRNGDRLFFRSQTIFHVKWLTLVKGVEMRQAHF